MFSAPKLASSCFAARVLPTERSPQPLDVLLTFFFHDFIVASSFIYITVLRSHLPRDFIVGLFPSGVFYRSNDVTDGDHDKVS